MVKLHTRAKDERLAWRPVRETAQWQVQRQREEWEEWREWRDGVARRGRNVRRAEERKGDALLRAGVGEGKEIARLEMRLPGKGGGGVDGRYGEEVMIVRSGEWDEVQRAVEIDIG